MLGLTSSYWSHRTMNNKDNFESMYTDFVSRMRTYNETKIPRIIHQIWFSNAEDEMSTMPTRYIKMSQVLRDFYPNVKHMWWGRKEIAKIWEIPELAKYKDMFNSMEHPVLRADIGRILISYAYGGFYVDLDSAPNFEFLEEELFKDIPGGLRLFHDYYAKLTYRGHDRDFLRAVEMPDMLHPISNSMLISSPKHPFWLLLLDGIYAFWVIDGQYMIRNVLDIYTKTGPSYYANIYGRAQTLLKEIDKELYPLDYEYPVQMKHILGTKWQLGFTDETGMSQITKIIIFIILIVLLIALFFIWRYRDNLHKMRWYGNPKIYGISKSI